MAGAWWSWIAAAVIAVALGAFPYTYYYSRDDVAAFPSIQQILLAGIGVGYGGSNNKTEPLRPCFPALFGFGSSMADTGNYATIYPSRTRASGQSYFAKPSNRFSDGRLLIDFWAQALNVPLLSPYLRVIGADFARGVNFACTGSTARQDSIWGSYPLSVQLDQFKAFKQASLDAGLQGSLPSKEAFEKGLYIIAIGGNDLIQEYFHKNLTVEAAQQYVPEVSQAIVRVVEELYKEGARTILVEDVYPQGCTPNILSQAAILNENLDAAGCSKPYNDNVKLHNKLLKEAILNLNTKLKDPSIIFVDTYSVRYEIIANASLYGFTEPIKACCGAGERYNFDMKSFCGWSKLIDGKVVSANSCSNPKQHVNWDGIHFTDEFNYQTMKQILTEAYFHPNFPISQICDIKDLHVAKNYQP
ncbi:hypothetical protein O6H91_12G106600 [Diphasiastrum complanatum]|uniref:Uncharacterized protein n=2 Tax=Diphasiastrum complanatum TaxID=34168 RepID=A0ACC2C5M8_DIPCM|nr:hypothetical protein O6H91_12G106600 [Diphasiastrum complanatum]